MQSTTVNLQRQTVHMQLQCTEVTHWSCIRVRQQRRIHYSESQIIDWGRNSNSNSGREFGCGPVVRSPCFHFRGQSALRHLSETPDLLIHCLPMFLFYVLTSQYYSVQSWTFGSAPKTAPLLLFLNQADPFFSHSGQRPWEPPWPCFSLTPSIQCVWKSYWLLPQNISTILLPLSISCSQIQQSHHPSKLDFLVPSTPVSPSSYPEYVLNTMARGILLLFTFFGCAMRHAGS